MDERRAVPSGLQDVRDRVERLVVDLHELRGVHRLYDALGEDDRDPIPLVARDVGQRIVRRILHVFRHGPGHRERRLPVLGEVGRQKHGDDALCLASRLEVDALHACVRVRATDDDHRDRARHRHIVDVRAAPGQEGLVLAALDRGADVRGAFLGRAHHALPIAVAASCTATTMLW